MALNTFSKKLCNSTGIIIQPAGNEVFLFGYRCRKFTLQKHNQIKLFKHSGNVKYYAAKGFSVQAGPQIGILLKANNKYYDNFLGYDNNEKFDLKDYSDGIDTSVNFGLRY